ncbi:Hsp70 family protein [Stutzerimonas chloritidismutans]|uniref:Hsp70 family protein n=1 Tax=Stutzerimonas chloritidismutans TaxID=203192 RepID=UPI00384B2E37
MAYSMRKRNFLFAFVIAASYCSAESVVVEDNSPAVQGSLLNENVGIETLGGVLTPILNSRCKIPCRLTQVFSTAEDNQDQITIYLARGQQKMASQSTRLGRYRISGIAPAPRGTPQIEVEFAVINGQILLSAKDIEKISEIKLEKLK